MSAFAGHVTGPTRLSLGLGGVRTPKNSNMTNHINSKRGIGIGIVGFTFVVLGFIFLVVGKAAIGLPILGVGLVFIVAGVAAARKAPPPNGSSGPGRVERL